MSWFGNVLKFEGFNGKEMLKDVLHDPTRLITGVDPFSTKLWNGILGTDKKPIVDQMGGATGDRYRDAEAAGIDVSAGKGMQNVAHVIAALAAAGYGAEALGGAGGGAGGAAAGGAEAGGGGAITGGGLGEIGTSSTGWGMGGDALTAGDLGGGSGAYDMGSMFGGSGGSSAGGAASGGTNWQKLAQSGMKGFNGAKTDNSAQLRQQQMIADQLRKSYEAQQQLSQQLPGWVNTSGA